MKASLASDADGRRAPRTPRVTVTDPRITVVEGPEAADAAALDTAITLFVKWAIRAHEPADSVATEGGESASPAAQRPLRPLRPQLTT